MGREGIIDKFLDRDNGLLACQGTFEGAAVQGSQPAFCRQLALLARLTSCILAGEAPYSTRLTQKETFFKVKASAASLGLAASREDGHQVSSLLSKMALAYSTEHYGAYVSQNVKNVVPVLAIGETATQHRLGAP